MFKKIGIIFVVVLVTALAGAYFFFAGKLVESGKGNYICSKIQVTVLDSATRSFVKPLEVKKMTANQLGRKIDSIDICALEKSLTIGTAIKNAQVYTVAPDILAIEVTQREPVVRIMDGNGGYYLDESGFSLPLSACEAQLLPTVTGVIQDSEKWKKELIAYTEIIRNSHYWSEEIEQIVIDSNSNIELYARSIDQKIVFGSIHSAREKFEKLAIFYSTILPKSAEAGKKYKVVNLKYKDQIICK